MAIVNHLSWMIGGPQGTGVDSSATLFARSCAAGGLWVYGKREYHSNIMGKHSYFQVRVSDHPVRSHIDPVHLLATFENSTAEIHAHELIPNGAFVYDPNLTKPETLKLPKDTLLIPIDFEGILKEVGKETGTDFTHLMIMKNTVAVAASFALVEFDIQYMEKALRGIFSGKKEKLVPLNILAAEKTIKSVPKEMVKKFQRILKPIPETKERLLITGTSAAALGKLKAGCRFQTYYPISPATDESVYLEGKSEYGILVIQAEDEMAALQLSLGASIMGARASTSTSGPGFCLMVEGLGWASMNEVPVVIFNYQRGGPSTGLPTRTEQGDLFFAIHAGHGEGPRIIISPGDYEEYFQDAFQAFNYADKYQVPVIFLGDKALAGNTQSVLPFDESKLKIDRGLMADPEKLKEMAAKEGHFKRFELTQSGVSPRTLPGQEGGIYWMTGDEHDELGHITENHENRLKMHQKRMKKYDLILKEIPESEKVHCYGDENAEFTVVTWGSTKQPVLDAMDTLAQQGIKINVIQIHLLWPFPAEEVKRVLGKAKTLIDVELNYTGQLADLIRRETGISIPHEILKWTGRPISETEMVSAIMEIKEKKTKRLVLSYGL